MHSTSVGVLRPRKFKNVQHSQYLSPSTYESFQYFANNICKSYKIKDTLKKNFPQKCTNLAQRCLTWQIGRDAVY